MSDWQQMSECAKWRQVLRLGEQLMAPAQKVPPAPAPADRELIVETTQRLLGGQVRLWLDEEIFPPAPSPDGNNPQASPDGADEQMLSALMRRAIEARLICCYTDTDKGSAICEGERCFTIAREPLVVAAPLLAQEAARTEASLLGVIEVERPDGPPFKNEDIELLEGLALQAALALQTDRQVARERWRVEQLNLVRKVSAQIANVRDLDELARRVTSLILTTFDYYYVAIFTLEPGQDVLHFRASAGPGTLSLDTPEGSLTAYSPTLAVHLGEGIIGYAASSGEEVVADDVRKEPRYHHTDALAETLSEVTLPLKIEDRVLGVLDVQSDQANDFHETDLLVLRALAGNIAVAIEGAQLYSALRKRAEQLSAISEVSRAIASILDQDELLYEVVNLIQKRFGYPWVHIFDVHPGRRKIFYQAGSDPRSRELREKGFAYDLDDPHGLVPWAARQGDTIIANDVHSEPRYRSSMLAPDNTLSELVVPMVFGGQVLGVLDVQSDQPHTFGEEDRFLFEALADSVAVAMRNATLYRSEVWRRQVADSLHEVAGLLSADVDLDQVLDAILAELKRNLPCDVAAIWLLEGNGDIDGENGLLPLQLAAVHSSDSIEFNLENGLNLEDMHQAYHEAVGGTRDHTDAGLDFWLVKALHADQPVIRDPQTHFDPLGEVLQFPDDYSAIAAPLKVGEQHVGLLTLVHRTSGRYGTEARSMTAAFASYAAAAIENTRLYEAAHEQAWVSTVLLQVSEATQSITNLNELLVTVARITPMLVGVKACALYMLDESEVFVPATASGLNSDQLAEFERWRFAPGDVPALDRLREEKQAIVLLGETEDPRLSSILFSGLEADLFQSELLILVPLLARGEVLGTFLIDYSDGQARRDDSLEEIFDERLSIVQGIAHQTAIAVENMRLLKAQQDEAYVSVALLQVAQAIVSSNELDEALESIVRITPILVGVKRTLIYLWDDENRAYWLAQAYGIARNTGAQIYLEGEFPLLDAVRQENGLFAAPLDGEDTHEAPDIWADFSAPSIEDLDHYLENAPCLLIALPLSVKGEVLGIMLIEEPDPAPANANRRLREKRLEIMTGISQQTAMAVQNSRLQQELLERGRLEREMQLAREIQTTFLPSHLPELDGWELNVLWRTAREVGGDFYDVFELPGQRLGLVIADVADKGMPAALFMTLIRTLVRATVKQIDEPGDVLASVNDVLVPDAQQGMFVTLVYAVLSLDTGELTFANAGHNPPLLLRYAGKQIERLVRGGMALGVLDGNRVDEQTVTLEPGDFLIFYTDGVTEAFSVEGDLYEEQRLHETIQAAFQEVDTARAAGQTQSPGCDSAADMLEAIDRSVSEFIGEASLSDDLTLVVLRRKPV